MQPPSDPPRSRTLPPLPPVRPQTKTKWAARLFKLTVVIGIILAIALPIGLFVKAWVMGVSSEQGLQAAADGDHQKAIEYFSRAISEGPRNAEAYCGRANSYLQLGNRDQAIADYQSCLEFTVDLQRRSEIGDILAQLRE